MPRLLAAVLLASCATAYQRPLPAGDDPSNPDARAASAPAPALYAASAAQPVDAGVTVYGCPMHPEVKQPGPGRCPKCGMELVPR